MNPLRIAAKYQRIFEQASEDQKQRGITWYEREGMDLLLMSTDLDFPPHMGAGVAAALSPMINWKHAKQWAKEALTHYKHNVQPLQKHTRATHEKVLRILRGEDPQEVLSIETGPKTHCFYRTLIDSGFSVAVIDRHMLSPFDIGTIDPRAYHVFASGVTLACEHCEEKPRVSELQATVWLAIREDWD